MSNYALRVVVEKVDLEDDKKVLSREDVTNISIEAPDTIEDLGLRHGRQIEIIGLLQEKLLLEQAPLLKPKKDNCAHCDTHLVKNGYEKSKFHSVFTDHEIRIQKLKCLKCKKAVIHSVKSLLGSSVHPDLYRLQCEQGAIHTYRKAEHNLDMMCNVNREINNHNRIKKITNSVGEILSEKHKVSKKGLTVEPAKELIVQVDGGHIKTTETEKRSIEVMSAKVYRPESVIEVTEKRSEIKEKHCVASAKYDRQSSMKKYLKVAAIHQGMIASTKVIAIADGAKNCWGIMKSLEGSCSALECILDWFHIAKKFEPIINLSRGETTKKIKEIKAHFWNGAADIGLNLLSELKESLASSDIKKKINGLYAYIHRNKEYLTNYNAKAENGKTYTSQVAESTVEHLINDRHKRNQKMQWSRAGAHNVLQIRAAMTSNSWEMEWQDAVYEAIKLAV